MKPKKRNISKNKILILIYLEEKHVPKNLKSISENLEENKFSSENIIKNSNEILVLLTNFNFDLLQMNFLLILIGKKLYNFCQSGFYDVKILGGTKLKKSNLIFGWELESYQFLEFKKDKSKPKSKLLKQVDKEIEDLKNIFFFVRNLINMPANILGPNEIFEASKKYLFGSYDFKKITGKKLSKEYPLISAVGKGASKSKQAIFSTFISKKKNKRKIFIIGKGVSFDTGGLNLKTGSGMSLMKKDMGGAANAIGLAKIISNKKLNVEVNLLLCLVENSLSENSMRPSDIYKSKIGKFIEVSDTDAEGRLIMADALTHASERKPDLIIDLATLTGASRVAMGLEVPSFFSNNLKLSELLSKASNETGDPLWQLPLWQNYNDQILSKHADYKNIGNSGFGGAITAALFLEKFVKKNIPWIHVDLMAWTKSNQYSSYEGGEAMGIIALSRLIELLYPK